MNVLWLIVFFAAQQIAYAFAVIILLLVAIIGFMASVSTKDRAAALLFLTCATWVAFAAVHNGYIVAAN